jgi:hypothetical protein
MSDADDFEFELLERSRAEAPVNPDSSKLLTVGVVAIGILALALVPMIAIPALVVLWLFYALSGA